MPISESILPIVADTHASGEVLPPSSENSESDSLLPTPLIDQPTFSNTAPSVPTWVGRDENGHCIKHVYDENIAKKVAEWVALGASENDMAICLNMRPGKLRELYFRELATGKFNNDMQVGNSILALAKAGVPQMAIFYAKARMGWSDKDKSDQNGDGLLNIHIHT